jgi:hypothetical protein
MYDAERKRLLDRLDETHAAIQTIFKGIDLDLRVYSDSDWRIRDILGHMATWDREVTKTLRAFLVDSEYVIADLGEDESDFNARAVAEQRKLSTQQVVAEWEQAREDFKTALLDIPGDRFPGDLRYPWGDERGSIARLVGYMIEHDEEHRDEILAVVKAT